MKLFKKNITAVLAFNTTNAHNRLTEDDQLVLIEKLSQVFGGATLHENFGGYIREDNGKCDCEYSYTIDLLGVNRKQAREVINQLAKNNHQESFIFNKKLVFTAWFLVVAGVSLKSSQLENG